MEGIKKNYKYIIYARKSTEDAGKQILSIDSQISELKGLANNRGLDVIAVLQESKSAKKEGRPVFNDMLKMVRKGQAQGIIAWKLDRLSRNPYDSAQIDIMLQKGIIKHIVTFDKECNPNDNVVMRAIEFSMANQYIIDLSNNVRRGNRFKLEKGVLPGRAPLGYLNLTDYQGNKSIVKDPQTFDLVRKMWTMLINGKSVEEIRHIANTEWGLRTRKSKSLGGCPLSTSVIYRLFSNPFYAGIIRRIQESAVWEGKGVHEPMITLGQFEKAQCILGRDSRIGKKSHNFAYRGLLQCGECGGMVTSEEKFKNTSTGVSRYVYYHCTKRKRHTKCSQGSIREEYLEAEIFNYLKRIQFSDDFRDWLIQYFNEGKDIDEREAKEIIDSQKDNLNKIDNSLKRITDLLVEGTLDSEEYTKRKQDLQRQKWLLEEKITQTESNLTKWFEPARDTIILLNKAVDWFSTGTKEEKRELLKIIGSNHLLKDKKLLFQAVSPFSFFENFDKIPAMRALGDEVRTFFTKEENLPFIHPVIKKKIDDL